jgi:hypothetical protein
MYMDIFPLFTHPSPPPTLISTFSIQFSLYLSFFAPFFQFSPRRQQPLVHQHNALSLSVADPHPHPHDFGLLDPHPESAFQMRIPDADADPY